MTVDRGEAEREAVALAVSQPAVERAAKGRVTEAMVDAGVAAEQAEGCWSSVDIRQVVGAIIQAALDAVASDEGTNDD